MVNTYIPGFSNALRQPEYMGGPTSMQLPPSVQPSAPAIMQTPPAARGALSIEDAMNERDMFTRANPSMLPGVAASAKSAGPQYDPVTGLRIGADGAQGYQFITDRGRAAGYGSNKSGFIVADPNAQYRMFDERGKNKVVAEGTGLDALKNIYGLANQFNKEQGKKANYGIERLNPATGKWERIVENDPAKNVVGKIADIALPVAASFIPGVGPVLGAALGSGLSSVAQGRSLKDTLLRSGLSAATAGAMGLTGADKAISGALSSAFAPAAGEVARTAAQKAAEGIIVSGARSALPAVISSAVGGGLGSQLASMAPGQGANRADFFQQPTTPPVQMPSPLDAATGGIDVVASRLPAAVNPIPGTVIGSAIGSAAAPTTTAGNPIEVTAPRPIASPSTIPVASAIGSVAPGVITTVGNDIEVTAPRKIEPVQEDPLSLPLPPLNTIPTTTGGQFGGDRTLGEPEQNKRITLEDINKYLRAAGLLSSVIGGGGGGQGGLNTIPGGLFGGSGGGSGFLPAPTLPGASDNFAPRAPADIDYYRYGYGPEQSFFGYVPQGEKNTSQAYTGYAMGGMAVGGGMNDMAGGEDMYGMSQSSFAVSGPGTGRSDEIPAMLSDGEYVMDAETVALLGDGSSKAGADRLDELRVNLRKHKGQKLAQGDFSGNAKRPEQYLKGGRA